MAFSQSEQLNFLEFTHEVEQKKIIYNEKLSHHFSLFLLINYFRHFLLCGDFFVNKIPLDWLKKVREGQIHAHTHECILTLIFSRRKKNCFKFISAIVICPVNNNSKWFLRNGNNESHKFSPITHSLLNFSESSETWRSGKINKHQIRENSKEEEEELWHKTK